MTAFVIIHQHTQPILFLSLEFARVDLPGPVNLDTSNISLTPAINQLTSRVRLRTII